MDVFSVEIWSFNSSTNTKDLIFIYEWIKITYLAQTLQAYSFTVSHSDKDAHFILEISSSMQFDNDTFCILYVYNVWYTWVFLVSATWGVFSFDFFS